MTNCFLLARRMLPSLIHFSGDKTSILPLLNDMTPFITIIIIIAIIVILLFVQKYRKNK